MTLTRDELIKRIQLSEDYMSRTAQLAEDKRKVLPYVHVIQTQAFQELCEEMSREEPGETEKELVQRMRRGDTAAAALLILRRGKERI